MITLKEWMEIVDYRITEGSDFQWGCFGHNAYSLDSWNGEQDGHSFTIIFDTKTQEVYEVQAHDYVHQRAYRLINSIYAEQYRKEAMNRSQLENQAWDDVTYTDLEVDDDFIQKALAIKAGEDYDTNISVPLELTDEEMLKYMVMAHERNMTFNQFVTEALQAAIEEYKRDPEGMKDKADQWKAGRDIT
jgi:hypothetical protein